MAKNTTFYVCSNDECDKEPSKKWFGKCKFCGGSAVEKEEENILIKGKISSPNIGKNYQAKSKKINDVDTENAPRIDTGINQINMIFGSNHLDKKRESQKVLLIYYQVILELGNQLCF